MIVVVAARGMRLSTRRAVATATCLVAVAGGPTAGQAQGTPQLAPSESPTDAAATAAAEETPHVGTVARTNGGYALVVPVPGAELVEGDRLYVNVGGAEVELELRYRTSEGFVATVRGEHAVTRGTPAFANPTRPVTRFDGRGRTPTLAVPAMPGDRIQVVALGGTRTSFRGFVGSASVTYRRDVWEVFGELRPSVYSPNESPSAPDVVSMSGAVGVGFAPRIGFIGVGLGVFTNPHDVTDSRWSSYDVGVGVLTRARIGALDGVNLELEFLLGPGAPKTYGPASAWSVGFGFPVSTTTVFAFHSSGYQRNGTILVEGRIRQRVTASSMATPVYVYVAPGGLSAPTWSDEWGKGTRWSFAMRLGLEVRIPR